MGFEAAPVDPTTAPWRFATNIACPVGVTVIWPERCPMCNRPANEPVERVFRHTSESVPLAGIVVNVAVKAMTMKNSVAVLHPCAEHTGAISRLSSGQSTSQIIVVYGACPEFVASLPEVPRELL